MLLNIFAVKGAAVNYYYLCADLHLYQEGTIVLPTEAGPEMRINQYIVGTGGTKLDDSPFLLLEDYVESTEWFNTNIEYPENTDAFYLGFSKSGGSKVSNSFEGGSQIELISSKHIRILNMLSTHAIVYVSKRYKETVMNEMMKVINAKPFLQMPKYNTDVIISRLHENFNIYGYHYPLFFQSDRFGNVPYVKTETNFCFYT